MLQMRWVFAFIHVLKILELHVLSDLLKHRLILVANFFFLRYFYSLVITRIVDIVKTVEVSLKQPATAFIATTIRYKQNPLRFFRIYYPYYVISICGWIKNVVEHEWSGC